MRKLQNRSEGFTIIELLIVLAIAALIILVVLIAVPQLQRNQRNQARQSIAGRIVTEVNNFAGNNNGSLPTGGAQLNNATTGFTGGFATRYLNSVNINDPRTGVPGNVTTTGTPSATAGDMDYTTGRVCNGETSTTAGASARNFALVMRLEGGATYCLDNR